MLNWLGYILGQLLHFWLKAGASVASPASTVQTYGAYFRKNGAVLAVRFFAASCIFVIWTEGGAALFGEGFLPSLAGMSVLAKGAVCGLIGLAMDSILDKVMVRLPWLQNEIPPAPNGVGHD
ncbi:MAG: hypothetical protein JWO13_2296 [Acidobacteriales bacterium]|nr:hypothetical protein [Terriglobales bacterium]